MRGPPPLPSSSQSPRHLKGVLVRWQAHAREATLLQEAAELKAHMLTAALKEGLTQQLPDLMPHQRDEVDACASGTSAMDLLEVGGVEAIKAYLARRPQSAYRIVKETQAMHDAAQGGVLPGPAGL